VRAFDYHRPASVKDAVALGEKKSDGRYLAGGQSLVQAMKLRLSSPSDLIDLNALQDLKTLRAEGGAVTVGAMVRHAEVASSSSIQKTLPALASLAGQIGDRQVRHLGTVGGSLANNDPAADYPAAALGLGATITTNKRKIEADKFFTGLYETALQPGELITSVSFPVPKRAAYVKFKNPASRFAIVGVFVAQTATGARVAVTGAGAGGVFRVKAMEDALAKSWSPQAVRGILVPAGDLQSDLHASADYRSQLVLVMAQRAIANAA